LKRLWSPWRMKYISEEKKQAGCVFCLEPRQPDGVQNLILYRGKQAYVILNRYPYTSGHLMVVPFDHQPSLEQLRPQERAEMMELVAECLRVLRLEYRPEGFNIGVNIGEAAGAGILEHVHLHVVPRWTGDTNFMSALGETRVLPESLEESYQRLQTAWKRRQPET